MEVISSYPRKSIIPSPEAPGTLIEVTNDIVITKKPTDIYYGQVKFKKVNGTLVLDDSNLSDLTPDFKDLPAGVEARVMQCNLDAPMLPLEFFYQGIHYRSVWIYRSDLEYVCGMYESGKF